MPSLLSPAAGAGSRSYTPLADEVNPPYGNHAPAMTRNGTVVYGKRASPVSDTTPDFPGPADDEHARYNGNGNGVVPIYRSGSNETLSTISTANTASLKGKGKERAVAAAGMDEDEDGDIGELRRGGTLRASTYGYSNGMPDRKGKGKERAWDPEMGAGAQEVIQESYPPGNEALDDERRIQDTLAKFAARDMARRRAARLSRQAPVSPTPAQATSPVSATTSFMRRPFSLIGPIGGGGGGSGGGEGNRSSVMGIMGAFIGGGSGGSSAQRDELPLASPTRPHMAANPYDPPPRGLSPTPRMVSPTSPQYHSPFADPLPSPSPRQAHPDLRRDSLASSSTSPPIQSPTDGEGFTYGYAGAGWRGGAGALPPTGADGQVAVVPPKPPRGERWWHALCSWGDDLDGGHDDQNEGRNQAGRTNPFE